MGKIKNNVLTKGFSGKFADDLEFRQVDGKTIFTKRRLITKEPTAKQLETRSKFRNAASFASAAIENEEASVVYKQMAEVQGLRSAYLAAVTDYFTLPEIGDVYTGNYKGKIGDVLNIRPKVQMKVTSAAVRILDANGVELEAGNAIAIELKWKYTCTKANANVPGSKIVVTARDRQGKESVYEKMLS